jgi:hypothetical protein
MLRSQGHHPKGKYNGKGEQPHLYGIRPHKRPPPKSLDAASVPKLAYYVKDTFHHDGKRLPGSRKRDLSLMDQASYLHSKFE